MSYIIRAVIFLVLAILGEKLFPSINFFWGGAYYYAMGIVIGVIPLWDY